MYNVKFIYSEKAKKFSDISTLLLTACTVVKSKLEISQNFVAFSEYINLKGGVISEGKYFQFYPSSKNQTSQSKLYLIFLFRFKMRGTMIWFDFFGEWDQIEHTFLYYSTFNTDLRFSKDIKFPFYIEIY